MEALTIGFCFLTECARTIPASACADSSSESYSESSSGRGEEEEEEAERGGGAVVTGAPSACPKHGWAGCGAVASMVPTPAPRTAGSRLCWASTADRLGGFFRKLSIMVCWGGRDRRGGL